MTDMTKEARLDNLNAIQDFIASQAAAFLSEKRIQQVLLATEEALVNVFSYAYPKSDPGTVRVVCEPARDNGLAIRFEDSGTPFNMLDADDPDTTLSLEERGIGGLGIFFIRQMIDDLAYERKDGKNILTFTALPR